MWPSRSGQSFLRLSFVAIPLDQVLSLWCIVVFLCFHLKLFNKLSAMQIAFRLPRGLRNVVAIPFDVVPLLFCIMKDLLVFLSIFLSSIASTQYIYFSIIQYKRVQLNTLNESCLLFQYINLLILMNTTLEQMRKKLIQNKKLASSLDSGISSPLLHLQKSPLLQPHKSEEKPVSPFPEAQQLFQKDKKDEPLKYRLASESNKSIENNNEKEADEKIKKNLITPLFPNKSTLQQVDVEVKNVEMEVPKKVASLDQVEQIPKKTEEKNSTKRMIKDVELLKESLWNMESALKGLEHIRQKIKHNAKFRQKLKSKIHLLQQLF